MSDASLVMHEGRMPATSIARMQRRFKIMSSRRNKPRAFQRGIITVPSKRSTPAAQRMRRERAAASCAGDQHSRVMIGMMLLFPGAGLDFRRARASSPTLRLKIMILQEG